MKHIKDNTLLSGVNLFITSYSLAIMICPPFLKHLIYSAIVCMVISVISALNRNTKKKVQYYHKELVYIDIFLLILFMGLFYGKWIHSSKLALLADIIGISANLVVMGISTLLGVFAITAVDSIVFFIKNKVRKNAIVELIFCVCAISLAQHIQLQYGSLQSFDYVLSSLLPKFVFSICTLFSANYLMGVILCKGFGFYIVGFLITGWSIANYYVIEFHGSPLFFSELANFGTAMDVAGAYHFSLSLTVVLVIVFMCLEISIIRNSYSCFKLNRITTKTLIPLIIAISISAFGIYSHISETYVAWSWRDNIIRNGYVLCAAKDINTGSEPIFVPAGYSSDNLVYDEPVNIGAKGDYPDIIVILNETFCDLSYFAGIETDVDYLENFRKINNSIVGYAVTPGIGGGTNKSEFELLTSKSMRLIPGFSPFEYLDREIINRSVVQYMQKLGYHTTAMHCGAATNYSRDFMYPAMGFDEIYLGSDDFKHFSQNGNRNWLDADNYADLIDHYESGNPEKPQFMYLLTFQNHGGWEQNEDELDTVHVKEDYGDLTDDLNEYLSSVKLSADAFADLTEYFSKVDRHVIICMVGDHAPSFITKLQADDERNQWPEEITQRIVPYSIWSNFDISSNVYSEYTNMTDIIPMIIRKAELPESCFYSTLLNLHEQYPVRISNGLIVDSSGNISNYDDEQDNFSKLNAYYCLEYNSLMPRAEYREELFTPR